MMLWRLYQLDVMEIIWTWCIEDKIEDYIKIFRTPKNLFKILKALQSIYR